MGRQVQLDPKTVVREMRLAGIPTASMMATSDARVSTRRLAKPSTKCKARRPARARIDWPAQDHKLVSSLDALTKEMFRQIPPLHASFTAIEQRLVSRGYVSKRRMKLPRTHNRLSELAESKEQFRKRRFAWWRAQLSSIGMTAQDWKVIRQAGIRKEFVGQVLSIAKQWAHHVA